MPQSMRSPPLAQASACANPACASRGGKRFCFFMCLYGLSSYVRMDRLRCLVKRALFLVLFVLLSEHKRMLALAGVNYPKGLLKWAEEIGIKECVEQLDMLYEEYREDRYRCCQLLRRMSKAANTFY